MAERALVAFGRYLRMLRERKALSLDEVAGLTRVFPSPLSKGYLSRLENGGTRAGFEKIVALARAYEVSVDVLAERLWLDLELEKNDPPETEGMTYQKLTSLGANIANAGQRWAAYGYIRDAVPQATTSTLKPEFRDLREQLATSIQNAATAAMRLGALQYALWEYHFVESMNALGPRSLPSLLTCIATLHRRRFELDRAKEVAEKAIEAGKTEEGKSYLGYAYSARSLIAHQEGNFQECLDIQKLALQAYRAAGREVECASAYHAIGEMFAELGRKRAARRSLDAAEKVARRMNLEELRVRIRLTLAEMEHREGNDDRATALWRESADMARGLHDRTLRFMAEFRLLRQALEHGRRQHAESLARRLQRLTPWILPHVEELAMFRQLVKEQRVLVKRPRPHVSN